MTTAEIQKALKKNKFIAQYGVEGGHMIEEDIINFMKQSWVFTGSDGNTGHPRKYGSFPKKYSEYVVNKKVLNLSKFIANSTSKPAEFFNVNKRGKIKEGYYADIIIFDPLYFKDKADYSNAFVYSEGLIYSIINGEAVGYWGDLDGENVGCGSNQSRPVRVMFSQFNPSANLGLYTASLRLWKVNSNGDLLDVISEQTLISVELQDTVCNNFAFNLFMQSAQISAVRNFNFMSFFSKHISFTQPIGSI